MIILKLDLEENLKELFNSTATIKTVPKGSIILSKGQIASSLYYIHEGILRGYYILKSWEYLCEETTVLGEFWNYEFV